MINGWPLFPGEDDEIREVQVCTSFVLLNRCTTRLYNKNDNPMRIVVQKTKK